MNELTRILASLEPDESIQFTVEPVAHEMFDAVRCVLRKGDQELGIWVLKATIEDFKGDILARKVDSGLARLRHCVVDTGND